MVVLAVDVWWCFCTGGVFGALVMLELVGNTEAGTRRRSSSTRGRAEEFTKYFHKNMVGFKE